MQADLQMLQLSFDCILYFYKKKRKDRGFRTFAKRILLTITEVDPKIRHQCRSYAFLYCTAALLITGRLPAAVAAHVTPQGGWVEFHPSAHPQPDPREATTALAIPTLRPLAWFRLTTTAETGLLRARDAESEPLPQSNAFEGAWWQDLAELGVRERWGLQCTSQSFYVLTDSPVPNPPSHHALLSDTPKTGKHMAYGFPFVSRLQSLPC